MEPNASASPAVPPELHAPGLMDDPYPVYRKLLTEETMTRSNLGFWVAAHHEDVAFILRDSRFGHDYERHAIARHGAAIFHEPGPRAIRHWLLVQNPPKHSRLRALFANAFSARAVKEHVPRIEATADALIDKVIDRGNMDLVADFAFPLPSIVISEILGVPVEDHAQFLTRIPARVLDMAPLSREESDKINEDVEFITAYFNAMCAQRRAAPREDLISALVRGQDQGGEVSDEELVANIFLLFAAGHETTANMIGNAVYALYRHPGQLATLKARPELMPTAVDELLRYDSSVQMTIRYALTDVETPRVSVKKGDPVMLLLGAAHRDPRVYPNPDALDVTRADFKVLSFGAGLHYCLGAQLARAELALALKTLFRRLPEMKLDTENVEWRRMLTVRGLRRLRASWT